MFLSITRLTECTSCLVVCRFCPLPTPPPGARQGDTSLELGDTVSPAFPGPRPSWVCLEDLPGEGQWLYSKLLVGDQTSHPIPKGQGACIRDLILLVVTQSSWPQVRVRR